jgi:hypothetical protein
MAATGREIVADDVVLVSRDRLALIRAAVVAFEAKNDSFPQGTNREIADQLRREGILVSTQGGLCDDEGQILDLAGVPYAFFQCSQDEMIVASLDRDAGKITDAIVIRKRNQDKDEKKAAQPGATDNLDGA